MVYNMIIHVVQAGETITSISNYYNVSPDRLIVENNIINPDNLAIGQTIVVLYPSITYIVQDGDTLESIAISNQVSVLQILANNPSISEKEFLVAGETLVIAYETNKISTLITSGYAYPFINETILRTTLPFLTYLNVFNYRLTQEGEIIGIDDSNIIRISKEYGVAPMMMVSTLNERGTGSEATARTILNNMEIQNKIIDNIINKLKEKGYYGLNHFFQYLNPDNQALVIQYIHRLSTRLHSEGFRFVASITSRVDLEGTAISYDDINYSAIAEEVDSILFLSYEWGSSVGPPAPVMPNNIIRGLLDNVLISIPSNKIFLGYPVIGYDWELPYIPGATVARSITSEYAVQLAADSGAVIQYNEIAESSYFSYNDTIGNLHIVWSEDARSVNATVRIVPEYNLQGLSVWNIMTFYNQLWLIINSLYDIVKVDIINI